MNVVSTRAGILDMITRLVVEEVDHRPYDEQVSAPRPTLSTAGNAVSSLLGAVVVSIVLGIVGMHALNTHGVMSGAEHAVMTGDVSVHTAEQMAGNDAAPALTPGDADAAAPAGGDGHGMSDMVMLCVAMLAAAGILLAVLAGLRRIPRVWAHLRAAPIVLPRLFAIRLGTGPPPVWEFSVIRC